NEYVEKAHEIVEHVHKQLPQRVSGLQKHFQAILDNLAEDSMLPGISKTGNSTKTAVDRLFSLLEISGDKVHFLSTLLHSKPVESLENVLSESINVASLFSPARNHLNNVRELMEQFSLSVQSIIDKDIPNLFNDGKDG